MNMLSAWFLWVSIGAAYQGAKACFGYEASVDSVIACSYWVGCAFLMIRLGVVRP
jgi:hypothetical protein